MSKIGQHVLRMPPNQSVPATSTFFESDHSTFIWVDAIVFYPRQFLFCYMEEVCISSLFEYFFSKMQKKSSTASPYYSMVCF